MFHTYDYRYSCATNILTVERPIAQIFAGDYPEAKSHHLSDADFALIVSTIGLGLHHSIFCDIALQRAT